MIQPNFVTCCTGCSEACYGIDLPSTVTATITDPKGTLPCLDGYSFEMVKTSFRGSGLVGSGLALNANDFILPVETGWAENLKIRSQFSYRHFSKSEEKESWYRARGQFYRANIYWQDYDLSAESIPYWDYLSSENNSAFPFPPRNEANWQIGSCVGYALDLDQEGNELYAPGYPSAYSRTTLGLTVFVSSPYQSVNKPTSKLLDAEMTIQSPVYSYSGAYETSSIGTFIMRKYDNNFVLTCNPFFLQFEIVVPKYFQSFKFAGHGTPTYSTIGATKTDTILVSLTE